MDALPALAPSPEPPSFGPESDAVELRQLNVLIGANTSGKSNLIDALDVLRATAGNLIEPIRRGG